jgi:hypothetical protein
MEGSGAEHTEWTDAARLKDMMFDPEKYEVVSRQPMPEIVVLPTTGIPLPDLTNTFIVKNAGIFLQAQKEGRDILLEMMGRQFTGTITEYVAWPGGNMAKIQVIMRDMTGQDLPDDLVEDVGQYMKDGFRV